MTEIRGKNILITGGGSGIGRKMARLMASKGGQVIICDINSKNLNKVIDEIQVDTGRAAFGFVCDISNRSDVYDMVKKIQAEIGAIDILINNAGIVSGDFILDIPDEKIEQSFGVNTLALFWTAKAVLPSMLKRNSGHIVTIASAAGLIGVSKLTDYCSSKFAAVGFDESLRVELKRRGSKVQTTVVCPYYIDTGMFEGVRTRFSFLLPILKEDYVVTQIIRAIEKNKQQLIMPSLVSIIPITRLLPTRLFDGIASLLGVNASMDQFKGRGDKNTTQESPKPETKKAST